MATEETGKTVKAVLKLIIDDGDAKRQRKEVEKDFDDLYKKATMSDWRRRNRVERQKDLSEDRRARKEEREHETAMSRSYTMRVREKVKERNQLDTTVKNYLNRGRRMEERLMKRETRKEETEEAQLQRIANRYVMRDIRAQNRFHSPQSERSRAAHQNQLSLQTLQMLGAGGIASRIGRAQAYGNVLTQGGMPMAGALLGRAAVGLGIAGAVGHFAIEGGLAAQRADSHMYADVAQKRTMWVNDMLPFTKTIRGLRGIEKDAAISDAMGERMSARFASQNEKTLMGFNYRRTSEPHYAQSQAMSAYSVVGSPTARLGRSSGENIQYEQQVRMQPLRQAERKSELDLAAARINSVYATQRSTDAEKEYMKAASKALMLSRTAERFVVGAGNSREKQEQKTYLVAEAERAHETAAGLKDNWTRSVFETQEAKAGIASAAQQNRAARIATERGELGNIEQLRDLATEGHRSLGAMGVGGRMRGKLAWTMIQKNGIEFASPDMIASARSVDPEGMDILQEQFSKKEIARDPFYKATGNARYGNLDDLRAQTDTQRQKVAGLEVSNVQLTADQLANIYAAGWIEKVFKVIDIQLTARLNAITAAGMNQAQKTAVKG